MGKKVVLHIHKLLDERNMSIRQLSLLSGVRAAALHALAHQKRQNVNLSHMERIGDALKLKNLSELITWVDIDDPEDDDD